MDLDFSGLAEMVEKNNMGLDGFTLEARADFSDDRVTLIPSKQVFFLAKDSDRPSPIVSKDFRRFKVVNWDSKEKATLKWQPPSRAKTKD